MWRHVGFVCVTNCIIAPIFALELIAPVITIPAKANTFFVKKGNNMTLPCYAKAPGLNTVIYDWMKDDEWVENVINEKNEYEVHVDRHNGSLQINNVNEKHNGSYECVASFNSLRRVSQPQRLILRRIIKFPNGKQQYLRMGILGQYFWAICKNKGTINSPAKDYVFWWYDYKNSQLSLDSGRLYIDTYGNLHYAYLESYDGRESNKSITCGVAIIGGSVYLSNPIYIEIRHGKLVNSNPTFRHSNSGLKAMIGSTAVLECFFSGYQNVSKHFPHTKWRNLKGREIKNGTKYGLDRFGRRLTIKAVSAEDDGNYTCYGETESIKRTCTNAEVCKSETKTIQSRDIKVKLDVVSPPVFIRGPKSQIKAMRKSATFECIAKSLKGDKEPEPPTWYINLEMIDLTLADEYVLSPDKKSLTIHSLKKHIHDVCLMCRVQNEAGITQRDACLNVIDPIVIKKRPAKIQRIHHGDIIWLTVRASVNPSVATKLNKTWIFRNQTYTPPYFSPHVTYVPETRLVYIKTDQLTSEEYFSVGGIYTLRLWHPYDFAIVSTDVRLMDAAPSVAFDSVVGAGTGADPVTASSGVDMWIIALVISIIFLLAINILMLYLICFKKPKDKEEKEELPEPANDEKALPLNNPEEIDDVPIGDQEQGDEKEAENEAEEGESEI